MAKANNNTLLIFGARRLEAVHGKSRANSATRIHSCLYRHIHTCYVQFSETSRRKLQESEPVIYALGLKACRR